MRNYPRRVADNILPLSIGTTLPEAFAEWSFTERTIDHDHATETCELCEQEELRYHYEIKNAFTGRTLLVGSQCILKFGLSVFEEGIRLSPENARRKLDRLLQKMRLESCINALERLAVIENSPILNNALIYYKRNKKLTPKYAFTVLWLLKRDQIDHSPSFFNVSLKSDKHKNDLRLMPPSRVHILWPAFTSSQRSLAIRLGHVAPTK